jgi:hypothetical protein
MARPFNDDLNRPWKLVLPATLAGRIEYVLTDPLTKKPIYGSRNTLVEALLEYWLARESGMPADRLPSIPTIEQLRARDH